MNKERIGENAGIVWRVLHNNKYSWEELVKATELNPLELAAAIGWLAREDKIRFSPEWGIMYLILTEEGGVRKIEPIDNLLDRHPRMT
mgnify:CR=1 FL=1